MMLPAIHPTANQNINGMLNAKPVINPLIQDNQGQLSTFPFPKNIAGIIPKEMRQRIYRWMLTNYIWPQVMERLEYEEQWEKLLAMSRVSWKMSSSLLGEDDTRLNAAQKRKRKAQGDALDNIDTPLTDRIAIADTVIFDAVDRLTNLNHFISFKESLPVRYEIPEDMVFANENESYQPMSALVKSANCWLKWNAGQQEVYRKAAQIARHHYTYGVSFVDSQFVQTIKPVPRRQMDKSFKTQLELTEIGITFEPLSIRKLWLNVRLPIHKMDYQPCPFYFDQVPRFAMVANRYHPETNPFGFANTENLPPAQWLFSNVELQSWMDAWTKEGSGRVTPGNLLAPEYAGELAWTLYPMLPLGIDESQKTPENPDGYVFDDEGKLKVPMARWICTTYGNNLCIGEQEILKLQRNFYPNDSLPLYGSAHMPTLDDGVYSVSIGSLLENHYEQLCKATLQYLDNKDWVNDPATTVVFNSPANAHKTNQKGKKIPVNSHNDLKSREPFDATQTTPMFMEMVRSQAQTSSKAVDAILGKAMGSRTSATEASNIFQTAMSGVTTDINLFAHDIFGGYAERVWTYTGYWVDPDILAAVTGSYGFAIKPEHLAIRLGLKWDIGSSFIDSLTRQQNYRYLLESSQPGDPSINRPYLYRALLKEWKMKDVDRIINDGGQEQQIQLADTQAIQTYLGQMVMVAPDQDHHLAVRVKTSFLADHSSVWNTNPEYVVNAPRLVQQIQQHLLFQRVIDLQMQIQQEQQMALQSLQSEQEANAGQSQNPAVSQLNDKAGGEAQRQGSKQ